MDSLRALIYGTQPTEKTQDVVEERETNDDEGQPIESSSSDAKKRKRNIKSDASEKEKKRKRSDDQSSKKKRKRERGEEKHEDGRRELHSDSEQSSSNDDEEEDDSKRRKPAKKVTMAPSSTVSVHAATAARLDAAYSQPFGSSPTIAETQEPNMPMVWDIMTTARKRHPLLVAPPVVVSSASLRQEQRHYSQPGRPPWKRNPQKAQANLENPSQRALRLARGARHAEYKNIKLRWKSRRHDPRGEEDVGGAIAAAAKLAAERQRQAARRKAQDTQETDPSSDTAATASLDEEAPIVEPADNEEVVDTSDEEQDNILDRLMKGAAVSAAAAARQEEMKEEEKDDPTKPLAERLDYWELGQSLPVLDQALPVLDFLKDPETDPRPRTPAQRCALQKKRKKFDVAVEPAITVNTFPKVHYFMETHPRYFPMDHNIYSCASFTIYRQVVALAARHIVGVAGGGSSFLDSDKDNAADLDQRWIQALWNEQVRPAGRRSLLMHQATLLGRYLKCYLQHEWKDRHKAAEKLGVTPKRQCVGPSEVDGYTLDPVLMTNCCYHIVAYSIRDESLGKLLWSPADDESSVSRSKSLQPHTFYSAIPGTVPPVPQFPLDVTNMIFGPADKFVHASQFERVPQVNFKLTLSSLLCRYAQEVSSSKGASAGMDPAHPLVQQIQVAAERAVELNRSDKIKWLENKPGVPADLEIPIAAYYRSIMAYCSLVLNGGVPVRKEAIRVKKRSLARIDTLQQEEELAITHDTEDDSKVEEEESDSIEVRVERLFEYCQGRIDHSGLRMFTPLHLVFGLLHIARKLPAAAIDLIARPVNDEAFETPFDLMRSLLEYLENAGILVDAASSQDKSTIMAGELEYALHQAALIFSKCVERDPTEVNYHCWCIAALSGSLLLCSGNRIGSGARQYPSSITKQGRGGLFGGFDTAPHEVRRRLPKFEHMRKDVARAFMLLSHLTKRQRGARAHLAMSSFLEWRQVVALMVGPDLDVSHRQICLTHQEHLEAWVYQIPCCTFVRDYFDRRESEWSVRLNELALILEREPSVEAHWIQLINALGPIGIVSDKDCSEPNCNSCNKLVDGRVLDHAQRQQESWWAKDRTDWWPHCMLCMRDEHVLNRFETRVLSRLVDAVRRALQPTILFDPVARSNHTVVESSSLEWLNQVVDGQESETADLDDRTEKVDHLLPCTFAEMRTKPARPVVPSDDVCASLQESLKGTDPALVMLTYQIVVAAHMVNLSHDWFTRAVKRLALACRTGEDQSTRRFLAIQLDTDGDALQCLRWLCRMGLDVDKILPVSRAVTHKL